jgi:hypothetical protein
VNKKAAPEDGLSNNANSNYSSMGGNGISSISIAPGLAVIGGGGCIPPSGLLLASLTIGGGCIIIEESELLLSCMGGGAEFSEPDESEVPAPRLTAPPWIAFRPSIVSDSYAIL